MKLFISYSRDDKSFVYELADKLNKEAQHDVWIDNRLRGADLWWDTILNSIEECDCFVLIMTPRAIGSIYCQAELQYALDLGKPIMPMKLKDCSSPKDLASIQYIDITSSSLVETLLRTATALSRLELRLLKTGKAWQFPEPRPERPAVPQAEADAPETIHETLAAAEEAYSKNMVELAEDLYANVMKADPEGLGRIASKRLVSLRKSGEQRKEYESIQRLVKLKSMSVAQELFDEFVERFGLSYDPENYAELFNLEVEKTAQIAVVVEPVAPKPVAKFEAEPPAGTCPLKVQFNNESQGRILQYLWDFNGDGITDSIEKNPSFTYQTAGKAVATLTVVDENGVSDSYSQNIFVDDGKVVEKAPVGNKPVSIAHPDYYAQRMVRIPAGHFFYGEMVDSYLDEFYIDIYPVTNQDYFQFMQATKAPMPTSWKRKQLSSAEAILPVTGISYEQAMAFCRWVGKRLPTALEWEKAARGTDGRIYPWGDNFDGQLCNSAESNRKTISPVNTYGRGASPFGVYDMSGNVWEWTQDEISARGIGREKNKVLKGGSFRALRDSLRTTASISIAPNNAKDDVGFRCVWSSADS